MTNAIAERQEGTSVVRSPKVLAALINDKWRQAQEAAEQAAEPFYVEIGELLIEAKVSKPHGEFLIWIKENFVFGEGQARRYMRAVHTTSNTQIGLRRSPTLTEALGEKTQAQRFREQLSPAGAAQASVAAFNFKRFNQEQADKQIERDLVRKLCLEIIDIGFKVLATKMHPDKAGGSDEAFKRLKTARDSLKERL